MLWLNGEWVSECVCECDTYTHIHSRTHTQADTHRHRHTVQYISASVPTQQMLFQLLHLFTLTRLSCHLFKTTDTSHPIPWSAINYSGSTRISLQISLADVLMSNVQQTNTQVNICDRKRLGKYRGGKFKNDGTWIKDFQLSIFSTFGYTELC